MALPAGGIIVRRCIGNSRKRRWGEILTAEERTLRARERGEHKDLRFLKEARRENQQDSAK